MKSRTKAYVFMAMFLALMALPRLLFIPLKDYVDTENYEKREYQEKPEPALKGLKEYPSLYEAYFNDYLAFKNPIVAFGKRADIIVFGEVSSDSVLMGKDNWMFYKYMAHKENALSDYQGLNHDSPQQLERFAALLTEADRRLSEKDIKLILYIAPNKEQVYSQYMPSTVKVVNEESRADLLFRYLSEHTDADVYYPLDELKKAGREWHQTYYQYDTHWNKAGAFVAAQMLVQDIEGMDFSSGDYMCYRVTDGPDYSGDLLSLLNLQKYYHGDPYAIIEDYKNNVTPVMDYENDRETVTHYTSDAENHKKILIFRDSFGILLGDYMSKNYSDVTLLDYRTEDCTAAVEEGQPDVVVIEVVERCLDYMFELLESLGNV